MYRQPIAASTPFGRMDACIAVFISCAVFLIFVKSPINYVGDSKYSLLLSQNLLAKHSLILDDYIPRAKQLTQSGSADLNGDMYQIEWVRGHLYYYFPPGSSILSLPFVALMDGIGKPILDASGAYSFKREALAQCRLAAFLMALLTVIFYYTARLLLPMPWSLCLALGGALGTQVWSTASRALWTHTWGILLLGWVIYLLLAQETGRRRIQAPLLASVLSWMYFVRPTNSIFIIGITVYIGWFYRSLFVAYAATGAAWCAAFVAYSWYNFGKILPSYYQTNRLDTSEFAEAIVGNLISPSRGMLTGVPVALFVVYLAVRYRREQPFPRLIWLALAMSAGHLAAVSCFSPWFGGVCFGPRYTTELVPWLLLAAVLSVRAMLDCQATAGPDSVVPRRAALVCGSFLLALSIFLNGRGALALSTVRWNGVPASIDEKPERVWYWSYPQALAGILRTPPPDVLPKLTGNRIDFGKEAAQPFEGDGWGDSEPEFCWSAEREADLAFATDDTTATRLRFKSGVFLSRLHGLKRQRVKIELNGQKIASLILQSKEPQEYSFPLPKGALQSKNVLIFILPDADSPRSREKKDDARLLGLAIYWLQFDSPQPGAAAEDQTVKQ